jgi:hypothetical protein
MRLIIAAVLGLLSFVTCADEKKEEPTKNYCHDQSNKQEYENLLKKFPGDTGVIRLYALRDGLCGMIDAGKLKLEIGIDIFELERSKLVIERTKEELDNNKLTI